MSNIEEQRLDIIQNCDYLLHNVLFDFEKTDATPEGRMITQLQWLKERAENHDLSLPVESVDISTLRYVYTDGELLRHATSFDKAYEEIDIYLRRVLALTKHGNLLIKAEYDLYLLRIMTSLLQTLGSASFISNKKIQDLVSDLEKLQELIQNKKITLPLSSYMPDYESFIDAEEFLEEYSDLYKSYKVISDIIFNGIRPNSWVTPEDADRETRNLI